MPAFIRIIRSQMGLLLLVMGLFGVLCAPSTVQAQLTHPSDPVEEREESQNRSFDRDPGQRPESGVESLPSWAEPSYSSRRRAGNDIRSDMGAPSPPGDPPAVPVDGGLLWLVIAGCGYGVHKLCSCDRPVHS